MNIPQAYKKLKDGQLNSYVLSECDKIIITVYKPQFGTFFNHQIECMGFSGKKDVYAVIGRFERVADVNNRHLISASEDLEKMITSICDGLHPMEKEKGMFNHSLSAWKI